MAPSVLFRLSIAASVSLPALGAALAQEATTELEPIIIEGEGTPPSDTSDRVLLKTTAAATKTATPVLETPQSVTTVTRKQIDEQNPQTVSEALRYSAGVLADRDANTRYDSVFLRGFGAFGTSTSYVN